jgi:hypothetical protein
MKSAIRMLLMLLVVLLVTAVGTVGLETEIWRHPITNLGENGTAYRQRLTVHRLDDVLTARIHLASPGANCPIAVWVYPSAPTS